MPAPTTRHLTELLPQATVHLASAILTGTGTLTASATRRRNAAASLTGTGTLTASATRRRNAAAALTGTGTLTAAAKRIQYAAAALTGAGSSTIVATRRANVAGTLPGAGSSTTVGLRTAIASASLSGVGSMSAAAILEGETSAFLTGLGTLNASAVRTTHAVASLTGTGELTAAATQTSYVLEPLRWVEACKPRAIALEQVPAVLPLWRAMGHVWERLGYSWAVGQLCAADYGVPQTRERAILVASLVRKVKLPPPTHTDQRRSPSLFLEPWVSMAQALGWYGEDDPARTVCGHRNPRWMYDDPDGNRGRTVGFPRRDDRGDSPDGYRERDMRSEDEPAFTLTEKGRSWTVKTGNNSMVTGRTGSRAGDGDVQEYERSCDEPAPTLDTMAGSKWSVRPDADLVLNTGMDWKKGGTREDAQTVETDIPAPALTAKSGGQWHVEQRRGGDRIEEGFDPELDPSATVTTRADRWQLKERQAHGAERSLDEPAMTITASADNGNFAFEREAGLPEHGVVADVEDEKEWAHERPATTIAGRALAPDPGPNANRFNGSTKSRNDGIRLSEEDGLRLQSFPGNYPVQGNRTVRWQQIGNAIPPLLARAVLVEVL